MQACLECRHLQTPFAVSFAAGLAKEICGDWLPALCLLRPPRELCSSVVTSVVTSKGARRLGFWDLKVTMRSRRNYGKRISVV
jgi:hypothetical protein